MARRTHQVKRTETRVGGGDMSSAQDVSISTHLSCDRIDRLESYFRFCVRDVSVSVIMSVFNSVPVSVFVSVPGPGLGPRPEPICVCV